MSEELDPRGELALLTAALRRHLGRESDRGRARIPAAGGATAAPAPPAAPGVDPGAAGPTAPSKPPSKPRSGGSSPSGRPVAQAAGATAPAAPPATKAPAPDAPPTAAVAQGAADLAALRTAVADCRACGLCETRTQTVFSDGDEGARVMFVGEAPGADEDRQGTPFVGRSGQLLTDIITKGMGVDRRDVYIANVLKCRPPGNRDPQPDEKRLCTPFLERQIELVDPEVIIPLGRHAAQHLLASDAPMGRLRGRVHRFRGRAVVPTYHPSFLLRSPNMKRAAWEDIQLAMSEIGLEIPDRWRNRPQGER